MSKPNRAMAKEMERRSFVDNEATFNTEFDANSAVQVWQESGRYDKVRKTRFATGPKKKTVYKWVVRGYVMKGKS